MDPPLGPPMSPDTCNDLPGPYWVAIKYVLKDEDLRFTRIPGETELLPVEVALMRMVSRPPANPYVLKLLEWFDTPERCILILERPVPCVDLYQLMRKKGRLRMQFARHVMRQVVLAVLHCRDRGVLHRDIKRQNVLLNTETLEVKLIDFGCGDLLRDTPYYTYSGNCAPMRDGYFGLDFGGVVQGG
ncbi:serine/threonine-protein kinase pim-1-like [Trichomycterus rosablanca]|uniref:serine/threonine-protein kinase pim-1-like n=1 Tax=Trichomycterus rosablanca TaxID=2290929 RepID=UPI002F351C6A